MNLLLLLPLLQLVLANFEDVEVGSLLVSDSFRKIFLHKLKATRDGRLSIWGKQIYLRPDEDGALKEVTRQRYLNIDKDGNVSFGINPQPGFSIGFPSQQLLYQDRTGFVLCGNGLIGFRSDCANSRVVFVTYKEYQAKNVFKELQPPNEDWYAEHLWDGKTEL